MYTSHHGYFKMSGSYWSLINLLCAFIVMIIEHVDHLNVTSMKCWNVFHCVLTCGRTYSNASESVEMSSTAFKAVEDACFRNDVYAHTIPDLYLRMHSQISQRSGLKT